ncbi:hypothetical protein J6590_023538 [Homalodisca vitripennis]|nr:hypothetical protein J6590_023538 [Homalodisca vitripennis]
MICEFTKKLIKLQLECNTDIILIISKIPRSNTKSRLTPTEAHFQAKCSKNSALSDTVQPSDARAGLLLTVYSECLPQPLFRFSNSTVISGLTPPPDRARAAAFFLVARSVFGGPVPYSWECLPQPIILFSNSTVISGLTPPPDRARAAAFFLVARSVFGGPVPYSWECLPQPIILFSNSTVISGLTPPPDRARAAAFFLVARSVFVGPVPYSWECLPQPIILFSNSTVISGLTPPPDRARATTFFLVARSVFGGPVPSYSWEWPKGASSSPSSYVQHLKSEAVADLTPEIWSHVMSEGIQRKSVTKKEAQNEPIPLLASYNIRNLQTTKSSAI